MGPDPHLGALEVSCAEAQSMLCFRAPFCRSSVSSNNMLAPLPICLLSLWSMCPCEVRSQLLVVIFFSLYRRPSPRPHADPIHHLEKDPKRTRNRPETDPNGPKRTRNGPKRTRNGPKSSSLWWDGRGVCRDGGELQGKKKVTRPKCL